jgi:hypothetical protein
MSAEGIDQISLRSLDQSTGTSYRRSNVALQPDENDDTSDTRSVANIPEELDDTSNVSTGYVDGGYGWVVTAGTYDLKAVY